MNWNYFTFLETISTCMDISTMTAVDTNIWTLETFFNWASVNASWRVPACQLLSQLYAASYFYT